MAWQTISGDTIVKRGDTYRTISILHRTSGTSSDAAVTAALSSVPYSSIEYEIERQYGIDVTVNNISAKKIAPNEYEQIVEFTCVTNIAPVIYLILVVILGITTAYIATIIADNLEKVGETFKIQTPFGDVNTFAIVIVIVAVIILLMILKR